MRFHISLLVTLGLSTTANLSQGGAALSLLQFGAGARPAGLGGAYTAIADDANSAFWNAANMAGVAGPELSGTHTRSYLGTIYDYLAGVIPVSLVGRRNSVGFYVFRATTGDIPIEGEHPDTSSTFALVNVGDFESYSIGLSIGREMWSFVLLGATARITKTRLLEATARGVGVDLALSFHILQTEDLSPRITLSALARGLGETRSWSTGHREVIPSGLTLAMAYRPLDQNRLALCADLERDGFNAGAQTDRRLGAELLLGRVVPLRIGYDFATIAIGTGFRSDHIKFDYAFSFHRELAGSHCISMAVLK
jgi:hypothetical protein